MLHLTTILIISSILLLQTEATGNPKTDNCLAEIKKIPEKMKQYQYLRDLQNKNQDEFYACLIRHVVVMLPIVYTPVVGEVCQKYAQITGPKRGLTLPITEANKLEDTLKEWKVKHPEVKAIVVTDGGRILGLGDLGANGMGIPVGKMAIYSALGGIHPDQCLPVTLDVGTNNDALRDSPLYVGIKQKRPEEGEYEGFVDKFMTSVHSVFGPRTLIQFEDFENKHAFAFLRKYRKDYTMFNDDIQGTAAVALAGILAAERFANKKLQDAKVLFAGAGEAGVGIANLIVDAMKEAGLSEEEARSKIYLKRSMDLVLTTDTFAENDEKKNYAKAPGDLPPGANTKDLYEIVKWLKPNILIGVTSVGGLFTKQILEQMAENDPQGPIIFPLSNPLDRSECTAQEAYDATKGKALFASGSPFDPVMVDGKLKKPQQCNNAYIFPGVAMGIVAAQMKKVPQEVFLIAAQTLAQKCTEQDDFDQGSLFPKLERLRECSVMIATDIAKYAFEKKLTDLKKVPNADNVENFIRSQLYKPPGI